MYGNILSMKFHGGNEQVGGALMGHFRLQGSSSANCDMEILVNCKLWTLIRSIGQDKVVKSRGDRSYFIVKRRRADHGTETTRDFSFIFLFSCDV